MDEILYITWPIKDIFMFIVEKSYNFGNILRESLFPKCHVCPKCNYCHYGVAINEFTSLVLKWFIWICKITSITSIYPANLLELTLKIKLMPHLKVGIGSCIRAVGDI